MISDCLSKEILEERKNRLPQSVAAGRSRSLTAEMVGSSTGGQELTDNQWIGRGER